MLDINIDNLRIARLSHKTRAEGMCLLEAVAYVAGEKHSDRPECVCPVIAAFGRKLNDAMSEDERQILKPYTYRLIGTKSSLEIQHKRAYVILNTAIKTMVPICLKLEKKEHFLKQWENFPEIVDKETTKEAFGKVPDPYGWHNNSGVNSYLHSALYDLTPNYKSNDGPTLAANFMGNMIEDYTYYAGGNNNHLRKQIFQESLKILNNMLEVK